MAGEINEVTLGVVQFACSDDTAENLATAIAAGPRRGGTRRQHRRRAGTLRRPLFLPGGIPVHFARAKPLAGHATIAAMQALAAELGVVIPVSFFEVLLWS